MGLTTVPWVVAGEPWDNGKFGGVLKVEVIAADGTPQSWTIKDPQFDEQGSLVQKIQLPPRFRRLSFDLHGKIQAMTQQKQILRD